MRLTRLFGTALLLGTIACGTTPSAVAQPKIPKPEAPLVSGELADEAAVVVALREHYTKHEYKIPMRDGTKLHTIAYVPKEASRTYPVLLNRTPYSIQPYGVDNYPSGQSSRMVRRIAPSWHMVKQGYILVHQDVRGRLMSEGTFVDVRPRDPKNFDEATDAYDTIEFLVKTLPRNNGKVGIWGISYPGFYAAQAAIDAHPALKAVSPQAPVTDWFAGDDFHHNGAFMLADAFGFYSSFGKPRPEPTKKMTWGFEYNTGDAYEFFLNLGPISNADTKHFKGELLFWNDLVAHPNLDDFWKARNPRPHYKNAKPAVMTVGGWFDAEDLFGALETYKAFETQSPGAENKLVMGPWRHGGWSREDGDQHGDIQFGAKTSLFYREKIEFPFFERHLRGAAAPKGPEAYIFETGTNEWKTYDSWPPKGAKPTELFFNTTGGLSTVTDTPSLGTPAAGETFNQYVSDPSKPVPYMDGFHQETDYRYMSADQRFASRRPDVLVFQTPELTADVALVGPVEAKLWVSTTGTDADFVVKLIDVFPADYQNPEPNPTQVQMGGYQMLVRAEVMRGRFRNGLDKPEAFEPNKPTLVRFSLPAVSHVFRPGHRLMVQVQSSWFPLVDRNPQTFVDIYKAKAEDFKSASHRVYSGGEHRSSLQVPVLRGSLR